MSVIIKGMEIPESCDKCPFGSWTDATYFHCFSMEDEYEMQHGDRLDDCPLIEIPEPHGRLIDADALSYRCGDWYTEEGTEEGFIGALKYLLEDAPTIIPTTEEET